MLTPPPLSVANDVLSFGGLAALYAQISLAHALHWSISDLIILEQLTAINPLASPSKAVRFVAESDAVRSAGVKPLTYTYDAVGNVTEIADAAQTAVFNRNQLIDAQLAYTYDSVYRLTDASGRELHDPTQPADVDAPFGGWLPDGNDLVNYVEHYDYDSAGNLERMVHRANHNTQNWTRGYGYAAGSNRLLGTSLPGAPDPTVLAAGYAYDAMGNIVSMPHLPTIGWDESGSLAFADQLGGGIVYHRYDGDGKRARKTQTRRTAGGELISYERIYVGDYELYRELDAAGVATTQIESIHVLDGDRRLAVVDTERTAAAPRPVTRYQIDNHLGSASLELDDGAALLSYEEYHPFGTTAFHARASIAEVSLKRYRFLGRERDDETGFDYCVGRHYCAWLGRWINPDPSGHEKSPNLYRYASDSPIRLSDPDGRDDNDKVDANIQDVGLSNPSFTPAQPVGTQTSEFVLTPLQPAFTPVVRASGSTGTSVTSTTTFVYHYRNRVAERYEAGLVLNIAPSYPLDTRATSDNTSTTGLVAGTLHYGPSVTDTTSQRGFGYYVSAGIAPIGGNGTPNATNPFASATGAYSVTSRKRNEEGDYDTRWQLDVNANILAQQYGSIGGTTVTGFYSAWAIVNVGLPSNFNIEGGGGINAGGRATDPTAIGNTSHPLSGRASLGIGWNTTFSRDYAFGVELIGSAEISPNVAGSSGVTGRGGTSGTIGIAIDLTAINRPKTGRENEAELNSFIRERDAGGP